MVGFLLVFLGGGLLRVSVGVCLLNLGWRSVLFTALACCFGCCCVLRKMLICLLVSMLDLCGYCLFCDFVAAWLILLFRLFVVLVLC